MLEMSWNPMIYDVLPWWREGRFCAPLAGVDRGPLPHPADARDAFAALAQRIRSFRGRSAGG